MRVNVIGILFLLIIGFFVYYFFINDTPENRYIPFDIRVRNAIGRISPSPKSDCINYYEPEELWDLNFFIHFSQKACLNESLTVKPSYFQEQSENIGGMKFMLKSIEETGITLINTENETFVKHFPTGKYEKLEEPVLLTIPKFTEKCIKPNIAFSGEIRQYCFVYGDSGELVLKVTDSY